MRKLFFILTLLLLHFCSVKAQVSVPFGYTGNLQYWEVPDGVWELDMTATGATGGNAGTGNGRGGRGAKVGGIFLVKPHDQLIILVGERGGDGLNAGGGGGTFILKVDPYGPDQLPNGTKVRLLLAAGGGGGGYNEKATAENHGSGDTWGGSTTTPDGLDLYGGDFGEGGEGWNAGGGGGYYSDGTLSTSAGILAGSNGKSFFNGAAGGSSASPLRGGYGGGGAGYSGAGGGAGGGGGYSGGAAGVGKRGGGGGSYIDASVLEGTEVIYPGINGDGNGSVSIVYTITVLPLKLHSFTAHLQQTDVLLKWTTGQERNTSHFEVERSTDGKHFIKIGQVSASGFSSSTKSYSYIDLKPKAKVNHYRLRMVDIDGRSTYSRIVVVRFETTTTSLQVFPNPASSDIHLQTKLKGLLHIHIFDMKGSLVKELAIKGNGASISVPVDVTGLNSGIYYIKVTGADGIQTASFIKK